MAGSVAKQVKFMFRPTGRVHGASVVGDFNDWQIGRDVMKPAKDGILEATLSLKPGRYEYKFYADGIYWTDPDAQQVINAYGTLNSVIVVE